MMSSQAERQTYCSDSTLNCQSKLISNVNASASAEIKSSSQEPALVSIAYSLITPKSIARLPSPWNHKSANTLTMAVNDIASQDVGDEGGDGGWEMMGTLAGKQ